MKSATLVGASRDAKQLEAQYGDLLERMPDAIVMVDPTGQIVLANSQAERLFGYARHELRGRNVEILIPIGFRAGHVVHRAGYFSQPRTRAMGAGSELFGLRKDGTEFPVEISLSPLGTKEGPLAMSAIRDISERKRIEWLLQEKNAQLQAANHELEAFSYSVSHDLRAPVRAMGGYARILLEDAPPSLPPEFRHSLERIARNARTMGALVDGLLALSALSRQPLARSRVDPEEIARQALEQLQPDMAGRRMTLTVDPMPTADADAALLRQVFANLLANALKYTGKRDHAEVRVGWSPEPPPGAYFVRDNGTGFDMAYAGKLFRMFQRLHGADQFQGHGVGLALVQRIIARHGGRIWANAAVDQGATFHFTLGPAPATPVETARPDPGGPVAVPEPKSEEVP